jgi:urate oxidase
VTSARISYGKLAVPVQRVSDRGLLAARVSLEVLGQRFLAAYTEGDNAHVVATDTMKNVVLQRALAYEGTTLEGLLDELGRHFLGTYPEMEGLALRAEDLGFEAVTEKLFRMVDGDHAVAELHLERGGDGEIRREAARSGLEGFRLLKTTGSAFTKFARDGATTLPERGDRPLFIHLDVHWRYLDPRDAVATTAAIARYRASTSANGPHA